MEADSGKLFIGGISWETNEDRLREYFGQFGDIVEVVIMRDRTTGRARGFGFIVFADAAVAELVTAEKHMIDGRLVEAKKAVPREDQSIAGKINSSSIGSPSTGRTRKIFVGGLPSSITEMEFKKYFEQFGVVTDVVVMYDHNTQRPRGFGFITYEMEEAVEKVLHKTFHELNGKMVEVKKAVPKEQSPGLSIRSPVASNNGGSVLSRINGYTPGYGLNSIGGYGMRVDGSLGLLSPGRNGFSSLSHGYGFGMNFEPTVPSNFRGSMNFNNSPGYARQLGHYNDGSLGRYSNPTGYSRFGDDAGSTISSLERSDIWENGGLNYTNNPLRLNSSMAPGSGRHGGFSSSIAGWGSPSMSSAGIRGASTYGIENMSHQAAGENSFGLYSNRYGGTNSDDIISNASFATSRNGNQGNDANFFGSSSFYNDSTWRFSSSEIDLPTPLNYAFGDVAQEVKPKPSTVYSENYTVSNKQTGRGAP